jgi:predicted PurR-regulated permease PerM
MMTNPINISPVFLLAAGVAVAVILIVFVILVVRMQTKIKRLLGGSAGAKSIEAGIAEIANNMKDVEKFRTELEKYLTTVESRLKKSVQSVQTIRFNPFKGTGSGGNQSFATAFLNQDGDVLSSLYSREHVSIFSKPVKSGKAEFELSEEEAAALREAQKGIPAK